MRILLSGITNWEEARKAVKAGVHALGFVLEPLSPRYINPERAREIILKLPPCLSTVGVFENTPRYMIQELTTFCRLDWLLFLGEETPKECKGYFQPVIKYLPQFDSRQDYETITSFLVNEEEDLCQKSRHTELPYIIRKGKCLTDEGQGADGLYFILGKDNVLQDLR